MTVTMLKSKIHRATVTEANLNYVGSITIDSSLMKAAGIFEYEKVQIVDVNNGSRIETYVTAAKRFRSYLLKAVLLPDAYSPGDIIIIMAYAQMTPEEAQKHVPNVIMVDENNHCKSVEHCEKHGQIV